MKTETRQPLAQVTLVIGKGGVGKTSIASGLAAAEAQRNGRAILVEFMDGESGARALGAEASPRSTRSSSVQQVVIEPQQALEELSADLFRSAVIARFVTGNFAMKRLFRAAPALRELAQLEVIRQLAKHNRNTAVVVDMPATGHGLAWLKVARQLETLLISGPLQAVAKRLSREFLVPSQCSIILVTLPERMVLRETVELADAMQQEVGLTPAAILVNRVPKPVSDAALEEAARWTKEPGSAHHNDAEKLLEALQTRRQAREEATHELEQSVMRTRDPIMLPLLGADPSADQVGEWLAQAGLLSGTGAS